MEDSFEDSGTANRLKGLKDITALTVCTGGDCAAVSVVVTKDSPDGLDISTKREESEHKKTQKKRRKAGQK